MTDQADGRQAPGNRGSGAPGGSGQVNPGWAILGYLLSGMAVYGGAGWLIGRWAGHQPAFLAGGMILGLALAIALTIFRFGRS